MQILDSSRANYNKERPHRSTCYFCDAEVIGKQDCTQFAYDYWYVLVNKHPYQNGNLMVVPKAHKTKLAELSADEWDEFSKVIVAVQAALTAAFATDSFNIALNEGADSGRSIAHLHWQIIPRWHKNHTAVGIFADIHVVTMSPDDLKERFSKKDAPECH